MKTRNQYIIPFGGLKDKVYNFESEVSEEFFDEFKNLEIKSGDLKTKICLDKKVNLLVLDIFIEGYVTIQCDRCLEYYEQELEFEGKLFVKFSENVADNDISEEVIFLHPDDQEIDLKQYIYESICLSLPYKRVHPDKNGKSTCNIEMLKHIEKHSGRNTTMSNNHTWDKLKKLL